MWPYFTVPLEGHIRPPPARKLNNVRRSSPARKLNNVRRSPPARKLKQENQNWLRSPITYGGEPLF